MWPYQNWMVNILLPNWLGYLLAYEDKEYIQTCKEITNGEYARKYHEKHEQQIRKG